MTAPEKSAEFDDVYRSPFFHWVWSDLRIPPEIESLVARGAPRRALELGCGLGRFSRFVAGQGVETTAVDFSPVAIDKARALSARDERRPEFLVGDVTCLGDLEGPYDVSFDVGCFHCLGRSAQRGYVSTLSRLLRRGGTHLLWALDTSPGDLRISPEVIEQVFAPAFKLEDARRSRRCLARSHWYWLSSQ